MRADRLVAVLLLLQARDQVTAAEVAEELEVSERTARRDLDALGMAGIPVYSVQGRGGGWRLAGRGRTDLSGLTAGEARSLFRLIGSADGTAPEVRAALRKLLSALPDPLRDDVEAARRTLVVDPRDWNRRSRTAVTPPLLDRIQDALVVCEQLRLGYTDRSGSTTSRVVHPLGLAHKAPHWYLLTETDGGARTFRVDRIDAVEATGVRADLPDDLDLERRWADVVERLDEVRLPVVVHAIMRNDIADIARRLFGDRLSVGAAVDTETTDIEIRGHSVPSLSYEIAGFGGSIRATSPPAMVEALAALGRGLVDAHRTERSGG